MSKERIEGIKNRIDPNKWREGLHLNIKEEIEWLIERVEELEDIIYQDARQGVLEGLYEENERYREALLKIDDYDIELGDMREDMLEKLLQIKYIKDKTLEELE